ASVRNLLLINKAGRWRTYLRAGLNGDNLRVRLSIDVATEIWRLNVLYRAIAVNWLPFTNVLKLRLDLAVGNGGVEAVVSEGLRGGAEDDEGGGRDLHLVQL